MTEKRFLLTEQFVTLNGVTFVSDENAEVDTYYTVGGAVDLLNDFADENEKLKHDASILVQSNKDYRVENEELKQQITNLYNMVKCDVDNEIELYPKILVEYLANILKIMGDVE